MAEGVRPLVTALEMLPRVLDELEDVVIGVAGLAHGGECREQQAEGFTLAGCARLTSSRFGLKSRQIAWQKEVANTQTSASSLRERRSETS